MDEDSYTILGADWQNNQGNADLAGPVVVDAETVNKYRIHNAGKRISRSIQTYFWSQDRVFVNKDLYALGSVTLMSMKTRPAEVSKGVAQGS